ncbi:MAG TPA: hypothetical protein VM842_08760, partial [Nitrospira sp.]|nr:hypothetical protein [Nitrospira sp.]
MAEPSTGKKLVTSKPNLVAFARHYAIIGSAACPIAQDEIVTALSWQTISAALTAGFLVVCVLMATAESPRSLPVSSTPCISAEDCFRSAVAINERSGSLAQREQAIVLKTDQLRSVMDLYPSTIWAKRAGVVLGVLLTDRAP